VEVILRCGWRGVLEGRERTEEEDGGEVCWGLEWMGGVEEEGGGNWELGIGVFFPLHFFSGTCVIMCI